MQNAFSERLAGEGFDFFVLLVVDLMHEFELGVWKNLLTHLIRILNAEGSEKVQLFNERCVYRLIAKFSNVLTMIPYS